MNRIIFFYRILQNDLIDDFVYTATGNLNLNWRSSMSKGNVKGKHKLTIKEKKERKKEKLKQKEAVKFADKFE